MGTTKTAAAALLAILMTLAMQSRTTHALEGRPRITRAHRAWRFYGVPYKSWGWTYKNKPLLAADRAVQTPDLAWLAGPMDAMPEKDHNFYTGAAIRKSVALVRDRVGKARWRIDWTFTNETTGEAIETGAAQITMGTFMHKQHPIDLQAPDVHEATAFTLAVTVQDLDAGKQVAEDCFTLTVYPRRQEPEPFLTVSILDPEGKTRKWLKACGVRTKPWTPALPAENDILVIGRGALTKRPDLPFTAEGVRQGLRVIIFAQHCPALGGLGFRHEDVGPRNVFARVPDHALLTGLADDGLRDWRGSGTLFPDTSRGDRRPVGSRLYHCGSRGTVASAVIETPQHGPFQALLDCEFDLAFAPLMTWRHGKGEVLFCQLDLIGRVELDPVATQVADRLAAYMKTPLQGTQEKTALCLGPDTREAVQGWGFCAELLARQTPAPAQHVVVVAAGDAKALAAHRDTLDTFLQAGGTCLVLYASEALLGDALFGEGWKLEETVCTRAARAVDAHPLLRGVGPQNIHWRMPVALQTVAAAPKGTARLLGSTLAVQPRGKGRLVLLQVDPAAFQDAKAAQAEDTYFKRQQAAAEKGKKKGKKAPEEAKPLEAGRVLSMLERSRWQVARLHSLLLGNLGLQSSPALAARVTSVRRAIPMTPVNAWTFFGPYPPVGKEGDPLERPDLNELARVRDLRHRAKNTRGEAMMWHVPSDSMNGMGLNGRMDLAKIFGVRLRDAAVAVTQVYSSRAREAAIETGADWWLRIEVNGTEVFRSGKGKFGVRFGRPGCRLSGNCFLRRLTRGTACTTR